MTLRIPVRAVSGRRLHAGTLTPTLSQRERGSEGAPMTLRIPVRAVSAGCLHAGTLTPTLSQRERGSEGA